MRTHHTLLPFCRHSSVVGFHPRTRFFKGGVETVFSLSKFHQHASFKVSASVDIFRTIDKRFCDLFGRLYQVLHRLPCFTCVFCAQRIAIPLLLLNLFGQRCHRLDLLLVRHFHQLCNMLPYLPLTRRQVPVLLIRPLLCLLHRRRQPFQVDVCISLGPSQRLHQARECRNMLCAATFLGPLVADKLIRLSEVAVRCTQV